MYSRYTTGLRESLARTTLLFSADRVITELDTVAIGTPATPTPVLTLPECSRGREIAATDETTNPNQRENP